VIPEVEFTPLLDSLDVPYLVVLDRMRELGCESVAIEVDPSIGVVRPYVGDLHLMPLVWSHQMSGEAMVADDARLVVYGADQPCGQARPPRRMLYGPDLRFGTPDRDDLVLLWPDDPR
jgi:hypothetical protein